MCDDDIISHKGKYKKGIVRGIFMVCPRCGSQNIQIVPITTTEVHGKTKGFGCIKACIGWFLFSLPGVLCGLCGMGKGKTRTVHRTKMVNVCQNCGNQF